MVGVFQELLAPQLSSCQIELKEMLHEPHARLFGQAQRPSFFIENLIIHLHMRLVSFGIRGPENTKALLEDREGSVW
jgi:hypothetical protein